MDGYVNAVQPLQLFTDRDLKLAIQLQQHLFPTSNHSYHNLDFSSYYQAALGLTGDGFDLISLPNSCLGIFIADASGKGLPAALIITLTLSLFRSLAPQHDSPASLLKELNQKLSSYLVQNTFVTAFYGIIDPIKQTLTFARAGHEAPLHSRHCLIYSLRSPGMALGIDKGPRFDSLIADSDLSLHPNDTITLFTDGVNETLNEANEEFGMERLKQAIQEVSTKNAKSLLEHLVKTLDQYRGSAPASDDLTLITLYVR